jgi:hypothetical protein
MEAEQFEILLKTVEILVSKSNSPIMPAVITVLGMAFVGVVTLISQKSITQMLIKSEADKASIQFEFDKEKVLHIEWQRELKMLVMSLLDVTDAKDIGNWSADSVIKTFTSLLLILDESKKEQKILIDSCRWLMSGEILKLPRTEESFKTVVEIHKELISQARKLLYTP